MTWGKSLLSSELSHLVASRSLPCSGPLSEVLYEAASNRSHSISKHFLGTRWCIAICNKVLCSASLMQLQSTLVFLKSKGLSGILRDIPTSTYQIWGIEEKNKSNNHKVTISKQKCNLTPEVKRYIENIVEKRRNCSLGAISPLFHNILIPVVRYPC